MKKKILKRVVGYLILILLIIIIVKGYYAISEFDKTDKRIQSMPLISFTRLYGDSVDYYKGRIVVYYFSPECEHCQYMTKKLVENCNYHSEIRFVMVTSAGISSAKDFIKLYHIAECRSISVYTDTILSFNKLFGSSIIPSFFIYENGILVKKVVGETKIENLLGIR